MRSLLFHHDHDEIIFLSFGLFMMSLETFFLGLALAMDAAAITFALCLLNNQLDFKQKLGKGLLVCSLFGFFQFLMLWLGSYGGFVFSFSSWGYLYPLTVVGIFVAIGVKFFHESTKPEVQYLSWGLGSLIILAFMTSLDALGSGISLGVLPQSYKIALDIGGITFIVCLIFSLLSQFFKNLSTKWLLRFGSFIFFALGFDVIWSYLIKG